MVFKVEVHSCLYNWLGYGNIDGNTWFIGTEEGGAEIWKQKTKTLKTSLQLRSTFSTSMDFKIVWEKYYNLPLQKFNTPNVWRYMAAFLMHLDNEEVNTQKIREYVFSDKRLGRSSSNHFMCELLPLPKPKKDKIYPYDNIWQSIDEYHQEVLPKRFDLIKSKLLVSFDTNTTNLLLKDLPVKLIDKWEHKQDRVYSIYEIRIDDSRKIYLLTTPFFGNGQASYEGLKIAAIKIKGLSASMK